MAWLALLVAGCAEITGVIGMKGITMRKGWTSLLLMAGSFAVSFSLLTYAMQTISMGTAYAVWTGIGTVGSAIVGMLLFGEPTDRRRIIFIAMVLCGAVGLKLVS